MRSGVLSTAIIVLILVILGSVSFGSTSSGSRAQLRKISVIKQKKKSNPKLEPKLNHQPARIPLSFYQALGSESFETFRLLYFQNGPRWTTQSVDDLSLKWLNQTLKDKNLAHNLEAYQFTNLLNAINEAIASYEKERRMMSKLKLRTKYENLFSGLLRAVQIASNYNVGLNRESYLKLTDQIYSQTFEIFDLSEKNYNFRDLFWDYQFLRALQFPTDLTHIHTARLLAKEDHFRGKPGVGYRGWVAAISSVALEKDHFIRIDKPEYVDALYKQSYAFYSDSQDHQSLRRVQKSYLRVQTKDGAQDQVYQIRCELARQQILIAVEDLQNGWNFAKLFKIVNLLIGYIFVALPLELILLIIACAVLWYQGRQNLTSEEQKKLGFARMTWIMFTRSYTGTHSNFYSKLASSLILFGVGLYFNSAKTLLENLITQ